MTIFRVQDRNGYGPYNSELYDEHFFLQRMKEYHDNWSHVLSRPDIYSDGLDLYYEKYTLSGFSSLEDLDWWFTGFLYELLEIDFNIVQLEVDKRYIKEGDFQLVFDSRKIKSCQTFL